jgi:xanthine dehydrogenase accessory factor
LLRALSRIAAPILVVVDDILPHHARRKQGAASCPAGAADGKLGAMASSEHGQHPAHGHEGHVHDASCEVAHGTVPAPAGAEKVIAAVFATPVASYLLRYAADAGYRAVLVEPDPERAKAVSADGFELAGSLDGITAATTDVVVTDHHRAELGEQLRDALAAGARWVGIMGNPRIQGPHIAALTELGVPESEISKVHRPIGINIGSRTPAEIAISTIAGLIADRNGKPAGFSF